MEFNYDCLSCHINQGIKVADFLDLDSKTKENIIRKIMASLATADYKKLNPELMTTTWDVITATCLNPDPYKDFKALYNKLILELESPLKDFITNQKDPFLSFLYAAILGNIIDLGPSHNFEEDNWLKVFENELAKIDLAINNTEQLLKALENAKSLLYLGDNCGEIVLDKLFISYIKEQFPDLDITFTVRDQPILNDITLVDADQVGLSKLVNTISNGQNTPGLIYSTTSDEFKHYFEEANIIIAKGQGNYEGLSDHYDSRIFHLFMVKCPLIASVAGVPNMSKVCLQQKEQ